MLSEEMLIQFKLLMKLLFYPLGQCWRVIEWIIFILLYLRRTIQYD
jgi:hypothetical protein